MIHPCLRPSGLTACLWYQLRRLNKENKSFFFNYLFFFLFFYFYCLSMDDYYFKSYGWNNYLSVHKKKHKIKCHQPKKQNTNKTIRCHITSFNRKCMNSTPYSFNMCVYGSCERKRKTKVYNVEWIFCEDSGGNEDIVAHLIEYDNLTEHNELYPIDFEYTYRSFDYVDDNGHSKHFLHGGLLAMTAGTQGL